MSVRGCIGRKAVVPTIEQLGTTLAVCRSSSIGPRLLGQSVEGPDMLRKTRRDSPMMKVGRRWRRNAC